MTPSGAVPSKPINVGQLSIQYLIDGTATGGMGVFELTVPPSSQVPPPHSHTRNEECVYVLEGVLRYSVDGLVRDLTPGEWVFTPRGSVHHFSNPHNATARALIVRKPLNLGVEGSHKWRCRLAPLPATGSADSSRSRQVRKLAATAFSFRQLLCSFRRMPYLP
jgi:quercetin dioxygenase-like cupin family protein